MDFRGFFFIHEILFVKHFHMLSIFLFFLFDFHKILFHITCICARAIITLSRLLRNKLSTKRYLTYKSCLDLVLQNKCIDDVAREVFYNPKIAINYMRRTERHGSHRYKRTECVKAMCIR